MNQNGLTLGIRRIIFCSLMCFGVLVSPAVWSQSSAEQDITRRLNVVLGGTGEVESVNPIPYFSDLYEVVVKEPGSRRILYSNRSGSHVVLGSLVDSQSMTNLTSARMQKLNRIDFDRELRPELALVSVYGSGRRKVAVFEDPRCGYCKKLRRMAIERLKNATVYTYVYPILGDESVQMAKQVMCSENPSKTWKDWMVEDVAIKGDGQCFTSVDEIVKLGRGLGIKSTPTIIFENGTRVGGAILPSDFERLMVQASRDKP